MISRTRHSDAHAPHLQPAGRRWGFGAHSVVPYLVHAPSPSVPEEGREAIRNPVFQHMDEALRALQRSH